MKLLFKTTNPTSLKNDITRFVENGELETWEIFLNSEEKYLKHIGQWGDKGVIKLLVNNLINTLTIQVFKFNKVTDNIEDFEGYYLGRFCELMFVNYPNRFTNIDKE